MPLRSSRSRSLMDEINRNLSDSTPLMGVAITAILVFACLLLGGVPLRDSRIALGFGAIGTILLAPLAGFGLSALLQAFEDGRMVWCKFSC